MAIEFKIDEETRYRLTGDKYNVVLDKAYWSKKNKTWLYGTNKTYHASFVEAVRRMITKEGGMEAVGSEVDVKSVEDIADRITALEQIVVEMFERLPDEIMGNIPRKFYLDDTSQEDE